MIFCLCFSFVSPVFAETSLDLTNSEEFLENIDYDASVNDSTNNEESNLSTTIENETEDDTRALKRVTLAFNKTDKKI